MAGRTLVEFSAAVLGRFFGRWRIGAEPERSNAVGAVCLKRTIAAGQSADYAFLLAWHFPNRTPARCGWHAPKGEENTIIGNWYATKFPDCVGSGGVRRAEPAPTRKAHKLFVNAMRESTLPPW